MHFLRSTFTVIAVLALSVSCSKKDHEVEPSKNCRYLGSNYTMEQNSDSFLYNETYVSDFKQDEDGKLIKASGIRKTTNASTTNSDVQSEVNETNTFTLKYDQQGFLTEMTKITLLVQDGRPGATFLHENYAIYHHGRIETKEVTTFKYEADLLRSSVRTSVVDFKSEKSQEVKTNPELKKEYLYDAAGIVTTITESNGTYTSVTPYKNGVKASTATNKYDEKGQLVQLVSPDSEYNLTYDKNGNILTIEALYQSKQQFLETRIHDNNPNPEKLLQAKFKGIPEEMRLLQFTDGGNNLTGSKSVYPNRPDYEEKTVYTYNTTGYPASAVSTYTQAPYVTTKTTTYNYQDCD